MATATASRKSKVQHKGRVTKVVRDAAAETTAKIIAALKAGTIPWHKEWKSSGTGDLPRSMSTLKRYNGSNVLVLWLAALTNGYTSEFWGTIKQINERGGRVRKGQKSTEIILARTFEKTEVGEDGVEKTRRIPLLRLFHVFNAEQCDWPEGSRSPLVVEPQGDAVSPIEAAEAILAGYLADGPSVAHGGDRAFYRPSEDHIQLPPVEAFTSAEAYHSTAFHEAVHSTGNTKRLARPGIADGTFGAFGDKVYSEEELVAELGAAFLSAIAGIEQKATLDNSAAYIAHWISQLEQDEKLIVRAASAAQKAVDLIIKAEAVSGTEEA
jgi:antirestriction protein ArdC